MQSVRFLTQFGGVSIQQTYVTFTKFAEICGKLDVIQKGTFHIEVETFFKCNNLPRLSTEPWKLMK